MNVTYAVLGMSLITAACCFVAYMGGRAVEESSGRDRHKHVWVVRGVEHGEWSKTQFPMTCVLSVCLGCGKRSTEDIDGNWTVEQLQTPDQMTDAQRDAIINDLRQITDRTKDTP